MFSNFKGVAPAVVVRITAIVAGNSSDVDSWQLLADPQIRDFQNSRNPQKGEAYVRPHAYT